MARQAVKKKAKTALFWTKSAQARVNAILRSVASTKAFRIRCPDGDAWKVDVRMVGGPLMKRINRQYRGKDKVTDILSFPAPKDFPAQGWLGELVVCLPQFRAQAAEHFHHEKVELDILLVHGILHLLGYDHEKNKKEAQVMARVERQWLKKIGVKSRSIRGLIDRTR